MRTLGTHLQWLWPLGLAVVLLVIAFHLVVMKCVYGHAVKKIAREPCELDQQHRDCV